MIIALKQPCFCYLSLLASPDAEVAPPLSWRTSLQRVPLVPDFHYLLRAAVPRRRPSVIVVRRRRPPVLSVFFFRPVYPLALIHGFSSVSRLSPGRAFARVVIRHVIVEVDTRCVVSHVSQHVVALFYMVKTEDADVVHLVVVARLVGRW